MTKIRVYFSLLLVTLFAANLQADESLKLKFECSTHGFDSTGSALQIGGMYKSSDHSWSEYLVKAESVDICYKYVASLENVSSGLSAKDILGGKTKCQNDKDGTHRLYLISANGKEHKLLTFWGKTEKSRARQCIKAEDSMNYIIKNEIPRNM